MGSGVAAEISWACLSVRLKVKVEDRCVHVTGADEKRWERYVMETYQWFLLGAMVAWTPGMLAMALLLWSNPTRDLTERPQQADTLAIRGRTTK